MYQPVELLKRKEFYQAALDNMPDDYVIYM